MDSWCHPYQDWMEWAIDKWRDLEQGTPEEQLLREQIFRESERRARRGKPRTLRVRDLLRRRDRETLRTLIWFRTRKMLRQRGVTLRSVPVARQLAPQQLGMDGL